MTVKNLNIPKNKKKILCFNEYYLPGHKSGGPVRTIENFVEYFGDEYEISIVCSDRDYLDNEPYSIKDFNIWHRVGKAKVFYISKKNMRFRTVARILRNTSYDLLYLNGLFSYTFTILPLLIRKINHKHSIIPCIIAPRGMLSLNARKLKSSKKRIFLLVANFIGLYKNLFFQASNNSEKNDIANSLNYIKGNIFIAPNLTTVSPINSSDIKVKKKGPLRLVFLSRISPMKNLDFLLRSLLKVTNPVNLEIYGNIDDENYFKECLDIKERLPSNIKVVIKGHIKNDQVQNVLLEYDLFVLPTRGENFGHVILEALAAGTPVLVSNKVFWKSDNEGGIQTLSLQENKWTNVITEWSSYSNEMLIKRKMAALNVANKYNSINKSFNLNRDMLTFALKSKKEI
tara:strand:- start:2337 stop:3536 length:1200 start_codon:yes stop_codon:yes gene_type:complete